MPWQEITVTEAKVLIGKGHSLSLGHDKVARLTVFGETFARLAEGSPLQAVPAVPRD